MMRGITGLTVLFALAVALAVAGQLDTGYVLIVYPPYRIDISLNFFIVALLLAVLLLYLCIRIAHGLSVLPIGWKGYRIRAKEAGAQTALQEALNHAFAGRFEDIEKVARRAALSKNQREAVSLIAAHAAHFRHDDVQREVWLASEPNAKWKDAHFVHTAFLYVEAHKGQAALDALTHVSSATLRNTHTQRIALRAHRQLQHWPEVLRLTALLEKQDGLSLIVANHFRQQALIGLLERHRDDAQALLKCWNSLSPIERRSPAAMERVVQLLIELQDLSSAQRLIETALEAEWSAKLLRYYPACAGENTHTLIKQAEVWRTKHPTDAQLLCVLGRLCLHQQLWGKAQAFFEEGLTIAQADTALLCELHAQLAYLHETLEQHTAAQRHYRECRRIWTGDLEIGSNKKKSNP